MRSFVPRRACGRARRFGIRHVTVLAVRRGRCRVGALLPLGERALDRERMPGVGAVGELQRFQRSLIGIGRAHVVARAADRRLRVVLGIHPLVRRRRGAILVRIRTATARRRAAARVRAREIVDPCVAVFGVARFAVRPFGHHAVAEVAGDAAHVAVDVVGRVVGSVEKACSRAFHGIVRRTEAGLHDMAHEPAARRVTAQAVVADTGQVVVRDVERREEQRIARRVRHHAAGPGRIRTERAHRVVVAAGDAVTTAALRIGRHDVVRKPGLRRVRREVDRGCRPERASSRCRANARHRPPALVAPCAPAAPQAGRAKR